MGDPRSCNNCRFAVFEEYGYSNWTVEGTIFTCAKAAHPDDGFDRWYGRDKRLEYRAECKAHDAGEPLEIDCDRECFPLSDEEQAVYDMANSKGGS